MIEEWVDPTYGAPMDHSVNVVELENVVGALREARGTPGLTLSEVVKEAVASGTALGKTRGLWFAGRFVEGDMIVTQWRPRKEARGLLGWTWPAYEIGGWVKTLWERWRNGRGSTRRTSQKARRR